MRPGYKQTEIGVFPTEWKIEKLGQLASFRTGPFGSALHKSDYMSDGVPVVNPMHIIDGTIEPTWTMSVTEQAAAKLSDFRMKPGEIVIGRRGDMGRCAVVRQLHAGWLCGTGSLIIRPRNLEADFLQRVLSSERAISAIEDSSVGTTMVNLNQGALAGLRIQLPPRLEQRAIAAALSDTDALLDGLEQLIAKKRDLKHAVMQQLLNCQTRLPGFSEEWQVKRFGEIACIRNQKVVPTNVAPDTPCIELEHIGQGNGRLMVRSTASFSTSAKYVFFTGDVLFGRLRSYLRKYWLADNAGICSTEIWPLMVDPDQAVGGFLLAVVQSDRFIEATAMAYGTHMPRADWGVVRNFEILCPEVDEQVAIAAVLSDLDAELIALEARRDKTRALKQGMVQELLTGRTRLVVTAAKVNLDVPRTANPSANIHFRRSVLAAEIIDRLHGEPTFGHVKFEKVIFLVEHLCSVDTGSAYHRDAAGPYDNRALRSIDSQLRKQKWFDAQKAGDRYRYEPMANRGKHKEYFDRYFAGIRASFDTIIDTFRSLTTDRCEIVATLFGAWNDLIHAKALISDDAIVNEVLNNWHPSKKRIPEDRWRKALSWMRDKGFVPRSEPGPR